MISRVARAIGRHASTSRGFSLLELIVVVILVGVLLVVAISRLLALRVDAERTAMESMLGSLRSALGLQFASFVVKGRWDLVHALDRSNPIKLLVEQPTNYLGELFGPAPGDIGAGQWYYDVAEKALVYRVRSSRWFESELGPPARARFTVKMEFDDQNANGAFDPGVDVVVGLGLVPLEPYRWTH